MKKLNSDESKRKQVMSPTQVKERVVALSKRLAAGEGLNEEESAFLTRKDSQEILSEGARQWAAIKEVDQMARANAAKKGYYMPEFKREVEEYALQKALDAVSSKEIELVDVPEERIQSLGKKWNLHLRYMLNNLYYRYNKKVDDLIRIAAKVHTFGCHYEASLRLKTLNQLTPNLTEKTRELTTPEGCDIGFPCGTIVVGYYGIFCGTKLLKEAGFEDVPPVGDVLMALGVNRIIQAARVLADDTEKALNLLNDFVDTSFLAADGEARIDLLLSQKENKSKKAREIASYKNQDMRDLVSEFYKS